MIRIHPRGALFIIVFEAQLCPLPSDQCFSQAMERFTSPVFLSVNGRDGDVEEGLGGVPDHEEGRSILFVGNHQLMGIDMPILVRYFRQLRLTK